MTKNAAAMLLVALLLTCGCQRLDPPARVSHPDEPVVLRAVDRDATPLSGLVVRVRTPAGGNEAVGRTAADGTVRFEPRVAGLYEFSMDVPDGPRVISLFHVVDRPIRWIYGVVLVPLGLLLLGYDLRVWRAIRTASRPGP